MEELQNIIIAYTSLNILSLVFSIVFYLGNRNRKAFRYNVYYWLSMIVIFIVQGAFNESNFAVALSFASTGTIVYVIALVIQELFEVQLPAAKYNYANIIAPIISTIFYSLGGDFTIIALPIALSLCFTSCHMVFRAWRHGKKHTVSTRFFLVLIFSWALHVADYPWLRMNQEFVLPGFYIAFLMGFFMSVLLPYVINELEQKKHSEELEDKVREKTREISQIAENRKIVSQLLAHDTGNQVYLIYQLSVFVKRGIERGEIPSKYQKWVDVAVRGYNRQKEMTAKARELLAAESGKVSFQLKAINLLQAIEASVDSMSKKADEKGVVVEYKCRDDYFILADQTLFSTSILNNLISNSIKFCNDGDKIKIRAFCDGRQVTIVHYDQGPGIPQDKQRKIFSANEATSTVGTKGEKGTGFGLPIVSTMVSSLKGELSLRSRCGDGHMTMFILKFNCIRPGEKGEGTDHKDESLLDLAV